MNKFKLFLSTSAVIFSTGCTIGGSMSSFQMTGAPRAAFEMDCDKDKLVVTTLANNTYGVTGCGKKAVYMYIPESFSYIRNSEIQSVE